MSVFGRLLRRTVLGMAWAAVFVLLVAPPVAPAVEREEGLAREAEEAAPAGPAPAAEAPPATAPGAGAERPALKLPEVVVKGERQFRVTAERRDLLFVDPMTRAKETPEGLSVVAAPGLDSSKAAPQAVTLTPKNYIAQVSAGAGPERVAEARLVMGQEFPAVNYLLRADYATGALPEAYGFVPFDQTLDLGLDLRWIVSPAFRLRLGLAAAGASHGQPLTVSAWGRWLEQGRGELALSAEAALSQVSNLEAGLGYGHFLQRGVDGGSTGQETGVSAAKARAVWEQDIPAPWSKGLHLRAEVSAVSQDAPVARFVESDVRLGANPWPWLRLNLGVALDEFAGTPDRGSADAVGDVSLLLPSGGVLYGKLDAGLDWQPTAEWAWIQPRPAEWSELQAPVERVQRDLTAGWRQGVGENLLLEAAWFKRDAGQTPLWLDTDRDGLFTTAAAPESHEQGGRLEAEIRWSESVRQRLSYVYRRADAGSGRFWPGRAEHEGGVEFDAVLAPVTVNLGYRYLGPRPGDPSGPADELPAAHLLGGRLDYALGEFLEAYLRVQTVLDGPWMTWRGYRERSLTALAGIRAVF